MDLREALRNYKPFNEQEEKDREQILYFLERGDLVYTRESRDAHMTASAWVTNRARSKIVMAYHNIYDSWAWLGGHADGEKNLLLVAEKEAMEESGLRFVRPVMEDIFSIEILTVSGHMKNGSYVPSHLHLNVTYLLEADPELPLRIKEDENSEIGWIGVEEIERRSTEKWFVERIYSKLCKKAQSLRNGKLAILE